MAVHTLMRPLGISHIQSPHDELDALKNALSNFERISFEVMRTGEKIAQIKLTRTNVPTASYGRMNITETVGGLVGDVLRLTYGETLCINDVTSQGVLTTFDNGR